MSKTLEMLKEQVSKIDSSFTVISDTYEGHYIKIKFYHDKCKKITETTPNSFISHKGVCIHCNGGIVGNLEDFKQLLEGSTLTLVENSIYENVDIPIEVYCSKCKENVFIRPKQFKLTGKCSECSGLKKLNTSKFKEKVRMLVDNEYTVLGEYVNNSTYIEMQHNVCNQPYKVQPKDFTKKNGNRCPFCKKSLGEVAINKYLKNHNLSFNWSFKDPKCANEFPLEFDFRVELDNDEYMYIEYDGNLHYKPWKKDDTKHQQHLLRQITNDRIKNKYCEDNNIPLLRIPYWEYENLEAILDQVLINCSSTTIDVVQKLVDETGSISVQDTIYENIMSEMKI